MIYMAFDVIKQKKEGELVRLQEKKEVLLQEQQVALQLQEYLQLHQQSYVDPAWMELILIQKLGVVPPGYHKALFQDVNS